MVGDWRRAALVSSAALVAVVGTLMLLGARAHAGTTLPACDASTRPAVVFLGLPARVPYGKHELYGIEHNDESSATVPGLRVRVEAYEGGKRFYTDYTTRRGSDLYEVWFGLGSRDAHVDLTYVEERPDGARCRRRVRHAI